MRAAGSAVLMAMLLTGCGSSIRMVHQSDVYFERCHTADFDSSVSVDRKQQCWAQWLEHYTEGQSPDRIRYARQRLEALEHGETIDPLPGLHGVGGTQRAAFLSTGRGAQASVEASARDETGEEPEGAGGDSDADDAGSDTDDVGSETSDDEPDPAEEAAEDAAAADAGSEQPQPEEGPPPIERRLPSPPSNAETACTQVCNPRWDACVRACERQPDGCEGACETEYRTCMRGCF